MQSSKSIVGLILAVGVIAGAGGAFFATRPERAPMDAATSIEASGPAVDGDATVSTEGFVREETAPRSNARPAPAPAAARPERRTAPASVSSQLPAPLAPAERPRPIEDAVPAPAAAPVVVEPEPVRAIEPAGPELIELVVSADSVIGLQLDSTITTERARVEDVVEAHVVRDVRVADRVAIPAGSRVSGEVTLVERGGRLKERARLGVRFTSIALPNGTRLPILTETVYREGESQATPSAAKIGGGALGGAIIGGILGGAKGAAIGGSVGAGAGTAAVMAGGRNQATFASGTSVTVRVEQPVVVTVER